MTDRSAADRVPALVRDLRARLRSHRRRLSAAGGTADATDDATSTAGYFCRTCGAGLGGRHGTCPECGGGMIEHGVETH